MCVWGERCPGVVLEGSRLREAVVLLVALCAGLRALRLVSLCRSATTMSRMHLGLSARSARSEEGSEIFLEGSGNS